PGSRARSTGLGTRPRAGVRAWRGGAPGPSRSRQTGHPCRPLPVGATPGEARMNRSPKAVLAGVGLAFVLPFTAHAQDERKPPGIEALEELREGRKPPSPVQNRFFLKAKRFEITPMVGSSPNNPFASRFSVSLALAYHFR